MGKVKWLTSTLVILALMAIIPVTACDDDDGNYKETTTGPTTAEMSVLSKEPVRIGVMSTYTGSGAMAGVYFTDPIIDVVKKQVEDMGGLLGGRPLEVEKYDTKGSSSGALTAATKAIVDDKLSVIAGGGVAGAAANIISDMACEKNVLYASINPLFDTPERKCMLESTISSQLVIDSIVHVVTKQIQPTPKTVAIITRQGERQEDYIAGWKSGCESEGIETVYEKVVPLDTTDFSSYLTKIKYLEPDVLITLLDAGQYMAMAKQMSELGGWGDIQLVGDPVVTSVANTEGTEGWLTVTPWHLGMDNPESKKFIEDFEAVEGRLPSINHIYFYFSIWTAIQAIEFAGTAEDGEAIIRAARSGELEFDTPMGHIRFNTDGRPNITMTTVRVEEGGELVTVE